MLKITPIGATLGARIEGIDLGKPLSRSDKAEILRAFGQYAVLCFPKQNLAPDQQKSFAREFGSLEINVAAGHYTVPGHPEVMVLSNIIENGKALGLHDAGQDWHTDMSYSEPIAFLNVLHALRVPVRNGVPLGATEFLDMYAAYDDLPAEMKTRIANLTATHDFNKFWEMMLQRPGTQRKPLTPEQRRQKPPVSHPIVLTHPISGRKALYCTVGYVTHIDGVSKAESDELLGYLFKHQLQEKYKYKHLWAEGDVLCWDNLSTMHNAVADYRPDEPRLMRRCQVMADWVFTPEAKAAAAA
ncbi:MAG: TauD/TfdA family dioxygenase [Proteobacteria bacterium]|nr:TauD/TfdA family dioxygenase [Pseudomonadota bacterium]